ncbi:myocardial zonula adherens protein [Patagioenas fasciata monilis]|uniref:Myocardial zonula adherens protein n=1 Tax=Patagioenas fasciata monilis TaxID=372326 RepID=A0A1V4JEL3_PATFA|nr:myocardial zonula adherens protein [Patagioenas fasciata monilis]
MLRYSSGLTVTATTSRRPPGDGGRTRRKMNVCRLRLTVPPDEASQPEQGAKELERKKNDLCHVPNGMPPGKLSHGMVYGVVHRTDNNHKREMVVYGWSADQLKEEMNYIKEVRATLEKVRKKMYGEYDEMKRKIQQLTNELKVTNAHQESLENHVRVQAAALDSFSEMNSSLTSASIDLQKTLVDVTLENTDIREQIRNLKHTHEQSMEKLREKQKQLETAQIENQLLKLKVESSQEANAEVMREMTRKLYSQYEEKMREEEQKHKAEKEILLEETNRLLKAIEEANKKMQITETSIQEKDQRIGELDRLIERMEEERHQLQKQLELNEMQISGAKSENNSDSERSQHLEEVAANLRERIKHLDDMVHCQQKKVKHMVEEIEMLKKKVKEKELFIIQLLEKISFLECENKELQDKLDYLMENQPKTNVETRDTGVGCDLPYSTSTENRRSPESARPNLRLPNREDEQYSFPVHLNKYRLGEECSVQATEWKFIARLPDKGKKISDFAEKLTLAISQEEELARTAELLSAVRLEFQVKQEEINTSKPQVILSKDTQNHENSSVFNENSNIKEVSSITSQGQEAECIEQDATNITLKNQRTHGKNGEGKTVTKDQNLFCEVVSNSATSSCLENDQQVSQSHPEDGTESTAASDNSKDALVDAFQKVKIVDGNNGEKVSEQEQNVAKQHKGHIFGSLHPKTPHYIEVLESRAKNPVIKKSKFKPNVLPGEQSGSSHGSSSSQSPGGFGSPITTEERRLRDKKHLNDITAARLPPLHHSPAKLLSIEESIAIQIQQKEAYEEMQAKLAAQKLAERLNIKMLRFEPEGKASMQYREARDEDYSSAED